MNKSPPRGEGPCKKLFFLIRSSRCRRRYGIKLTCNADSEIPYINIILHIQKILIRNLEKSCESQRSIGGDLSSAVNNILYSRNGHIY